MEFKQTNTEVEHLVANFYTGDFRVLSHIYWVSMPNISHFFKHWEYREIPSPSQGWLQETNRDDWICRAGGNGQERVIRQQLRGSLALRPDPSEWPTHSFPSRWGHGLLRTHRWAPPWTPSGASGNFLTQVEATEAWAWGQWLAESPASIWDNSEGPSQLPRTH